MTPTGCSSLSVEPVRRVNSNRSAGRRRCNDIAGRLTQIVARSGPTAFASFFGNPPAFHYSSLMWLEGFQAAIGSPWKYGVNGEDAASMSAACAILFGKPTLLLKPDLWRSDFVLIIGANPFVSHGSLVTEPRIREALKDVVERGGRVVVIDPRRTKTASQFEHLPIRAGSDAWLLAAMLRVIVAEGLVDRAFVERWTTGIKELERDLGPFTPEMAERRSGVPANRIVDLARSLATANSAVVYGRTGTCTQQFGTLNNLLQHLLNAVTGNAERPGGAVLGWSPIDFTRFAEILGLATYGNVRSRVGKLPEIFGMLPSQALAADITTPGEGQIRAMLVMGANPVISSGAGADIEAALGQLDLLFSIDLYINETNRHADYILPVPTFYERPDLPVLALSMMLRPTVFASEAVIERVGDTREDWEILDELARRMGLGGAYSFAPMRWLAKLGIRPTPRFLTDVAIRTSSIGDFFGLRRSGLSWNKLVNRHPHGVALRSEVPTGQFKKLIRTPTKRIPLAPPELTSELARLRTTSAPIDYPLRAHGMRETRSHNTWMHNSPLLMPPTRRYRALVNPKDVADIGASNGDEVVIASATGSARVAITITEDIAAGNVALPHGWGHAGGWQRANDAGGVNSNAIASSEPKDIEPLAGMSVLNGIPVRIERAPTGVSKNGG